MAPAFAAGARSQAGCSTSSHPAPALRQFSGLRIGAPLRQSAVLQTSARPARAGNCALLVTARAHAVGVGLWGTKAGMTQIFTDDGLALPATVIALEPGNIVTQVKTEETDGYKAVQVGYRIVPERKITMPQAGHLRKAGVEPMKKLREFRLASVDGFEPGQQLKADELFKVGDFVDVAGTSIGKGFQGTIKRWNHKRGLMTHGSKSHRQHGSIGSSATPSRVFPGLKMAGQMGNKRKTLRNLQVLMVDMEESAIVVKGSIPGKPGGLVEITPHKVVGTNC